MTESGERAAAIVEAANKIYDAQCDRGRSYDNALNYEQICEVIAAVEQAAFEAGRGGWISVAPDSLPEFDRKVLLLIEGTVQTGWRVAMENYKPGFWLWLVAMESPDDEDPTTPFNADQVQGWQPLPAPSDSGDANKK